MADLEKLRANLEARGFRTTYFPTADEAAAYLDGQIDGKTVGIGGSMTVKEMGLYPRLAAHNQVVWHWEGGALKDAVLTDVYITSANALAETAVANGHSLGAEVFGTFMANPAEAVIFGLIFVAVVCSETKFSFLRKKSA